MLKFLGGIPEHPYLCMKPWMWSYSRVNESSCSSYHCTSKPNVPLQLCILNKHVISNNEAKLKGNNEAKLKATIMFSQTIG